MKRSSYDKELGWVIVLGIPVLILIKIIEEYEKNPELFWIFGSFIVLVSIAVLVKKAADKKRFYDQFEEISLEDFYKNYYGKKHDFAGVYILHNNKNDKYYVGQSVTVLNRVNQHFSGNGNPDVYYDYRLGNRFSVRVIQLSSSNHNSLNSLERDTIRQFEAYTKGYNKNRGNRG